MTDLVPHARSAMVRNGRLSLFTLPATDLSLSAGREVRVNPQTTGISPITFQVQPSQDFIDMDRSYFEVELQVKLTDGNNIEQATRMLLANNLCHTLFKQISVRLNGTLISPQTDQYHLQAMLETLLHNDSNDAKNLLVPQGFYDCLDVPSQGEGDEITANQQDLTHADFTAMPEDRKRMVQARVRFLGGNRVVMRFSPNLEIFRLGRLIRPNVQLQIEMHLNPPSLWTVRQAGAINVRLTEQDISVRLYTYQIRVQPSVYREMIEKFNRGSTATYPTVRNAIRTYAHPQDNRHFECHDPFNGQVPNRLIVGLLKQTAFNGVAGENPFSFGKFNLSSIKLLVAGEEYPYETLVLNHDNANTDLRGYHRFLAASGCSARGSGNLVSEKDWGHGKKCNLFVFDTTANNDVDSPVLNPKQSGEIRLVMDFGANPGAALTVVVLGEFENVLQITGPGVVTYDVHQ